MAFDWIMAVERHHATLLRLFAALSAVIGSQMSRGSYRAALSQLMPLESALRRLIVIAARGVEVTPRVAQMERRRTPFPNRGSRQPCFALFDRRKRFGRSVYAEGGPCIRSFDAPAPRVEAVAVDPAALLRRVASAQRALGRLSHEAQRLARWRLRHSGGLRQPMRPGRPPGYAGRKKDEFQDVLRELDALARYALEPEKQERRARDARAPG